MDVMDMRRRLLMQNANIIPPEYRKIDWIESTSNNGTRINTGIVMTEDLLFEIDFQITASIVQRSYFMGQYAGTRFYMYVAGGTQEPYLQTAFGTNWKTTGIILDNDRHVMRYWFDNGSLNISNDGQVEHTQAIKEMSGSPIIIAGTTYESQLPVRTYGSKMIKSGVLIQNLIPCVRKSDNKPGMYDTVSKTFYTNAGAGEFIVPA